MALKRFCRVSTHTWPLSEVRENTCDCSWSARMHSEMITQLDAQTKDKGVFPIRAFSAPSWGLQHNWGWGWASPLSYRLRVPHHQPRKPRCWHPQPGTVHQATWQLRYGSSNTDGGLGMWLCFSFESRPLIYTFHVSVIFTTNLLLVWSNSL